MHLDILHPTQITRAKLLIEEIIHRLNLDLQGLVVLTEMGSGYYVYTPMIAALAGAKKIHAVVKDSRFGTTQDILTIGEAIIEKWGIRGKIKISTSPSKDVISEADIITNLGFLRPIDKNFISFMKHGAVIPYMREAWEYRKGDVDLIACRERNIPVMGTNESHSDLGIFEFCGPLAVKMLFMAGLEVRGNRIAILSQDRFGDVISEYLQNCQAEIFRIEKGKTFDAENPWRLDAIVVAQYHSDEVIIGPGGWIEPRQLAVDHPECTVIQFCGRVDVDSLTMHQIRCIPDHPIGIHRMAYTLADLGPKPVIDLHAAGLKVGELMWKELQSVKDYWVVLANLNYPGSLCQPLTNLERTF